jgi:hypothetical protein
MKSHETHLPEDTWVLRINTDECRYRLELRPSDNYQHVVEFVADSSFRYAES